MANSLSLAAQAVLDAAYNAYTPTTPPSTCRCVAAALRALVTYSEAVEIRTAPGMAEFDEVIRTSDLLAIATELEGING
jgi:hypothetical protein